MRSVVSYDMLLRLNADDLIMWEWDDRQEQLNSFVASSSAALNR